ncbi:DUF2795 domain-containing protein [Wenjunlia tyrosinilytica]|uniref:DUF2795 domain-containing protein n=1 Tax=Wenjunlia tyrosinilytica TaxID=1544741 RepID=A0A917ZUV0_9ACTN|nr:DUF2795 domain-containing protein [Wenjunlia tyrosinilytica]GGO95291.1 hypothetical protein GCM10012280_52140 [Wenjunlia tyrosinilytica]
MERGSSRLSVHADEEIKHELQGMLRSGHPTRSQEWHDPEPIEDDDLPLPNLALGTAGARSEIAKQLRRTDFPADRRALVRILTERHAPDRWIEAVERLPEGRVFQRVQEVVDALAKA